MNLKTTGLVLFAALTTASLRADYSNTVQSLNPVGYYRLSETTPNPSNLATNGGTIGSLGNGYYVNDNGTMHPVAGLLPGSPDGAVLCYGAASPTKFVQVPLNPANNPQGVFTAECWVSGDPSLGNNLYSLMTQGHIQNPANAPNRSGWLLYFDGTGNNSSGQVFDYRMYNHVGLNRSLTINGGGAPVLGQTYHVVVGYDGTNGFMYVNGALVQSTVSPGYFPDTDGDFTVGNRNDLSFTFTGLIAEVAYYTNVLSGGDVLAHYQTGTNASSSPTAYSSLVLAKHPIIYFQFNEPSFIPANPLLTTANLGTWGSTQDATIQPNVTMGVAGTPYAGFPSGNKGAYLNGLQSISGQEDGIYVPNPPINTGDPNGTSNLTFTAWIKRNGPSEDGQGHFNGLFAGILFERGTAGISDSTFPATGLCFGGNNTLAAGPANELRYHWNGDANTYNFSSGLIVPDQVWSFVAGIFTPSNTILCLNGVLATNNFANVPLDFSVDNLYFGVDNLSGSGRVFDGSIDEVAIFNYALTPAQLQTLYAAGGMPPVFTLQPSPATNTFYEGQSTSYNASAIGTPTITYQWQKNGAPISGQTTTLLSFSNLHVTDTANYALVAHNAAGGSVTSSVVALTVLGGPPIITVLPAPVSRYPDGSATFTVAAVGSTPLTYQWKLGSTAIAGATNTSFTVTQIQNADVGNYSVVVTNPNGSTNSPSAALSLLPLSPTLVQAITTRTPFAYWRLNETNGTVVHDSAGGLDGTFNSTLTTAGTPGPQPSAFPGMDSTNTAFSFNGSTSDIQCGNPNITVNSFTLVAFLKPEGLPPSNNNGNSGVVFIRGTGIGGLGISPQLAGGGGGGSLGYVWNNDAYVDSGLAPTSNAWNFVSLVIDGVANTATMYLDAGDGNGLQASTMAPTANGGTFPPMLLNAPVHLGTDPLGNKIYEGGLDEVALFSHALSQEDVQAIHDAAYLNVFNPTLPQIVLDPVGTNLAGGDTYVLTAAATGSLPLAFQWQKNGANIPGAIRSSLTLANSSPLDSGTYTWVVTQGSLSVTSAPAMVGVTAIIITSQPVGTTLLTGDSYTLNVAVRAATPTYQWQKNGQNIAGATATSLALTNVATTDGGNYTCVITSGIYTLTSATAAIGVLPIAPYVNLTNGLVLHLRLDDGNFLDSSGRGNDAFVSGALASGTPTNVPNGRIGPAVHIDNNDFLQVNDPNGDLTFDTPDSFSVSLWLRYTTEFNDLPVIGNAVNSTYQLGWVITEDAHKFEWTVASTPNAGAIVADPIGGPVISDGNWHNLVMAVDRTNAVVNSYIDGHFINAVNISALGTLITGNIITIGQDPTGTYGVVGQFDLDDVGIWRTVLDRASSELIYYAGQAGRSFDTVGPPQVTMSIAIVGGNLVINYSQGTLQSSTTVNGAYTTVVGANAPTYTTPLPASGTRFYRVLVQ